MHSLLIDTQQNPRHLETLAKGMQANGQHQSSVNAPSEEALVLHLLQTYFLSKQNHTHNLTNETRKLLSETLPGFHDRFPIYETLFTISYTHNPPSPSTNGHQKKRQPYITRIKERYALLPTTAKKIVSELSSTLQADLGEELEHLPSSEESPTQRTLQLTKILYTPRVYSNGTITSASPADHIYNKVVQPRINTHKETHPPIRIF